MVTTTRRSDCRIFNSRNEVRQDENRLRRNHSPIGEARLVEISHVERGVAQFDMVSATRFLESHRTYRLALVTADARLINNLRSACPFMRLHSFLGAGFFMERPSLGVAIIGQSAFQPGSRRHHRIMQLALKKLPWRQVGQVGGDSDAAFVELEQFDLFIAFVGAQDQPDRRLLAGLHIVLFSSHRR